MINLIGTCLYLTYPYFWPTKETFGKFLPWFRVRQVIGLSLQKSSWLTWAHCTHSLLFKCLLRVALAYERQHSLPGMERTKIWLRNAKGVTKKRGPIRNHAIRFWYHPVPSKSAKRSSNPFPILEPFQQLSRFLFWRHCRLVELAIPRKLTIFNQWFRCTTEMELRFFYR